MDDEVFKRWMKFFVVFAVAAALLWVVYSAYVQAPLNVLQTVLIGLIIGIAVAMALTVPRPILMRWLRIFIISTLIVALSWLGIEYYISQSFDYFQILARGALIGVAIATAQIVMFPESRLGAGTAIPAAEPEMPPARPARARPRAKAKAKKRR